MKMQGWGRVGMHCLARLGVPKIMCVRACMISFGQGAVRSRHIND